MQTVMVATKFVLDHVSMDSLDKSDVMVAQLHRQSHATWM